MARTGFAAATAEIASRDRVMAGLVKRAGPFRLTVPRTDHFGRLLSSIVYQQLAGRAAAAIHSRVVALFEGHPTPEAVLAMPEGAMRGAGLSAAKLAAIRDLASKVVDGTVPLDAITRLPDEAVIERLSAVRGIGRWTAEMFLIFQLRRMDVWPVDDYGVRKGYATAYRLAELPSPKQLRELGERFRPVRTAAAWYFWAAVDLKEK